MKIKLTNLNSLFRKQYILILMRTFIFLIFTTVFSLTPNTTFSQDKVVIDIDKEVSLDQVFRIIKEQTNYTFAYQENIFKNLSRIRLKKGKITVEKLLREALPRGDFNIIVSDNNNIIIKKRFFLEKLQQIKVSGKITDNNGIPIPRATVSVKGTTLGTISDFNGNYNLNVSDPANVLVFSSLGYVKKEIKVGVQKIINVTLEEDITELDEVVLNGYQSISKERVTGSFSTISSEDIKRAANNFNLKNIIEDLVPGLYFQPNIDGDYDATEEDSRSIVIRGVGTFGDNNPLIVVDGFPLDSEIIDILNVINPDDVESISVLKDAAAASIWGARAANGVIVIETKKGKNTNSKPVYRVSMDFLTKPKPNLSNIPWANSSDAVDIYKWLILDHDWFDSLGDLYYNKYELPEVMRVLVDMKANNISETNGNARLAELSELDVREEFSNLFLRSESKKKFNLNIQSGGRLHKIKTSITAMNSNGYAKGDVENNLALNIQDTYTPNEWLKISTGLSLNIKNKKYNGVEISELTTIPQHSRILDENGEYLPMIASTHYSLPAQERENLVSNYKLPYNWDWNLKKDVDNRDNTEKANDLRLYTKVNYTPIRELSVQFMYQYVIKNSLYREYYNENTWLVRNSVNYNARTDGTYPIPKGGMLYENRTTGFAHTGRFQLTYNKTIGEHKINLFGGTEIRQNFYEKTPSGFYGYDPQSLLFSRSIDYTSDIGDKIDGSYRSPYTIPYFPGQNSSVIPKAKDNRYVSYYGNMGYTFKNQYDITGSIRLDKTNLFGQAPNYRDLPQWSAGIGWTISEATFFSNLYDVVDRLRFRLSYGFNGNIDRSASPYIQGTPGVDEVYSLPYATLKIVPNPELTWEKTKVVDLGVEFSLFKNRLKGSVDYYSKYSTNVLVHTEVNGAYGFSGNKAVLNAGDIENTGVEVNLEPIIVKSKELTWLSKFNLGTNKNMSSGFSRQPGMWIHYLEQSSIYHIEGKPVNYMAAMRWAGYDEEGMPQFYYGEGENTVVYSAKTSPHYSTLDSDSILTFVGQSDPKVYGALINRIKYKNFTLSFNLSYKFGHKFWSDYPSQSLPSSFASVGKYYTFLPALMVNRWQSPSDGETASMNSLNEKIFDENVITMIANLEQYSSRKALDAGQIRLQSINLSYNIPSNILNWAKNAVINIGARNLGAIWVANKQGIDPSNPPYSSSLTTGLYFVTRHRPEFSLGIKFGL